MKIRMHFLCFVLLISCNCVSQFSKTHYIPPLSSGTILSGNQYLYISTPNVLPVTFRIIELGGNTIIGSVSRDTPYVFDVGYGNDTQLHVDSSLASSIINNKGYIVEADDLVYVSARVIDQSGNQAGELVSKGIASLGLRFRAGAFTNSLVSNYTAIHYTFVSVLATENNTTINFSSIKPGVQLINSASGDTPFSIVLNRGESYVLAVQGPNPANRDGLIGSLILADKPIAVNCGSFGGSNAVANLDLGFDQIVPAERISSNDYIFIKSTGINDVEKIVLVADEDNTTITLNGSTPVYTLNAGEYLPLNGDSYTSNGNLFVSSNKKVFAYQAVGDNGAVDQRNQELFFVPPISCQTPRVIDNIPFIDLIGTRQFIGRVTIVTAAAATLNFIINGTNYSLNNLGAIGVNVNGPFPVVGNANYETYVMTGLSGNVSVYSSGELYLAAYGSEQAATFGGFYSGFTFKPEVSFNEVDITQLGCIPNTVLGVNSLSPFDIFQWYFNGTLIPGANNNTYQPLDLPSGFGPGYYFVSATIAGCTSPKNSDTIPVSSCPTDRDNDGVNDNADLDNDNDGITNCSESFGDQYFNLTNTTSGAITNIPSYSNSYVGTVTTSGTGIPSTSPIVGDGIGNFVTEAAQGKENSVSYTISNFISPISLAIEYASTANPLDLFSSSTEVRITCPVNKSVTILNPNNQLLIDTNYDGIFESGVTQYSSFEIRFRLNNSVSLASGTGSFSIRGNLIDSLIITNINLSDSNSSRVALRLIATCIPKDSDFDGIIDQNDLDSDNDGILDLIEAQTTNLVVTNLDLNLDGLFDVFGTGITQSDNDQDGVPNYLDLDSDNDGIHDLDESGFLIPDTDNNGSIDGANFGTNGLFNPLETIPDSGIISPIYVLADTDSDGIYNAIELDSDNDLCNDVIEAGYLDSNVDGFLGGISPPTINTSNGLVTSGSGYGNPNTNYTLAAPIIISTQPQNFTSCELQNATFSVITNPVNSYQWEVSFDSGLTWTNVNNAVPYTGATTASLTITNVAPTMSGYQYRVTINKNGNSCGMVSSIATLTTYSLPVVTTPITLKQCDDDTDGISIFNLTQKNDVISSNYLNETFTYYTNLPAANSENSAFLIPNPIAFNSGSTSVFVRVVNSNGCYRIATIDLSVSVTQIPASFIIQNQYLCDDYIDSVNNDRDGISGPFDFTNITTGLLTILPNNVSIKYYKTQADFLAETDASGNSLAITNISNYRNSGFPGSQTIWIRVDSTLDNSCFGFKTFDVVVEALPTAYPINAQGLIRKCDDDHDGLYGFDTSQIQTLVLNGQNGVNVKYFRADGTQLSTPLPNPFQVDQNETITIRVVNNTTQTAGLQPCFDEVNLQFIVDDLPQIFPVSTNLTSICDDELNPVDQNGIYDFDTSTFQSTLLGSQTGLNIYYIDGNNNPLSAPLPNLFSTSTQTVKVIVENPINTTCFAQLNLPFIVNPTPKIDLKEDIIICLPTTQALINAGILDGTPTSNYTFQWFNNNTPLIGETNPTYLVNLPGTYSVEVTNIFGCTKTRVITVTGSEIATIQSIDVVDLADVNTITINVSGLGDYEFAIDDVNGPYRSNSIFTNVPMGIHDIYVRDKNGCGSLGPIEVAVLGIPHYFTPNGDGYNDTWNVKGVNSVYNYKSIIYIFDRFGKLLKQIGTTGSGWDGTFNGQPLPSDDYWYNISFEDGRSAKGHFALKR